MAACIEYNMTGEREKEGFLSGAGDKYFVFQCRRCKRLGFDPWVGKIPWSKKWQPASVFLPGEFHGQRSLVGLQSIGLQTVRHD